MTTLLSSRVARTGTLAVLTALGLALPLRAQTVDPSFGGSGSVTTTVGDASTGVRILTQTDDAIVVAGYSVAGGNTDALLLRYLPGGSLDPAFGDGDGIATSDFGGQDVLQALARQTDGAYVVAGYTSNATGFLVARYLADGTLDPSFGGGDGWTVVPVGSFHDEAHDLLVLPTGEIVVAGFSGQTASLSNTQWAVVQLTASGDLDSGFGSGGIVTRDFGGVDIAYRLGRDSAGKMLVTGLAPTSDTASDFTVLRLNPNGSADGGFGSGGVATLNVNDGTYSIAHSFGLAVTATNEVIVGGAVRTAGGDPSVAVAKFTSAGAVDTDFGGGDGWAAIDLAMRACGGQSCEQFNAVKLQADGKILGAGFVVTGTGNFEHVVARFLSDGTPDLSFDPGTAAFREQGTQAAMANDGAMVTSGADGVLTDAAFQPNNKLVATGSSSTGASTTRTETGQPLPVELVAFTATLDGTAARLTWSTVSETNNAGFAVEQEAGTAWAERGFVDGHGTTTERHDYAFLADALAPGRHRFRLRQVDFDGTTHYSAAVEVFLGVTELRVGRTRSGLYLWVPEGETADVYDVSGRRLRTGLTTGPLATDGLGVGVYYVRTASKTVAVPVLR